MTYGDGGLDRGHKLKALLLLDDAHAGEQYVGEQFAVDINRRDLPTVYEALLTAVGPALDGMLLQRLRDASPEPGAHQQVRLVVPLRHPGMIQAIGTVLAALDAPRWFRYSIAHAYAGHFDEGDTKNATMTYVKAAVHDVARPIRTHRRTTPARRLTRLGTGRSVAETAGGVVGAGDVGEIAGLEEPEQRTRFGPPSDGV